MQKTYFNWLAEETASQWNNDSAVMEQVDAALELGAIGIRTNPPLSYEALTTDTELYADDLAALDKNLERNEYAFQAMTLVAKNFSNKFMPLHEEKGGFYGCVRAQVAPYLRYDAEGMLEYGKRLGAIGKNIMVKIPGTKAGIWVLEELAALGIATNPTVVTTVAQAVAAGEAFDRGCKRAEAAGIKPAHSSCAVVMGREQDYLAKLNEERGLGLSTSDLEWAALAIVKRSYQIYKERGFRSKIMPAAFRCPMQVSELAGGEFCSTIHPKVQRQVLEAEAAGEIRRELRIDCPVDEEAVARVAAALPEFKQAYEPDGLTLDEFDHYGAVVMTLDGFDVTGWQKLAALKDR